jgi:drug/metabolite transporter (DMT)-like permease
MVMTFTSTGMAILASYIFTDFYADDINNNSYTHYHTQRLLYSLGAMLVLFQLYYWGVYVFLWPKVLRDPFNKWCAMRSQASADRAIQQGSRDLFGIPAAKLGWLATFVFSGIGLGLAFEFLDLNSADGHTPAAGKTFFLCLVGYWSQVIVGGVYALSRPNAFRGAWTRPVIFAVLAAALFDGSAQALDYVAQVEGGYMLFTIFHSSVTVFSCVVAVVVLRAKITWPQWGGVFLIVAGLLATAFPNSIEAPGSFALGITCSILGSASLAFSYPLSELVFRSGESEPISEEVACTVGSLINALLFSAWTIFYTVPRWTEEITAYIEPGRSQYTIGGYAIYGVLVGVHSLSFWKSVHQLGTVPTAVSKGAQQAGVFVFSHIVYCKYDKYECMTYNYGTTAWNKMQKPVAFVLVCAGVIVYAMSRPASDSNDANESIDRASLLEDESKDRPSALLTEQYSVSDWVMPAVHIVREEEEEGSD